MYNLPDCLLLNLSYQEIYMFLLPDAEFPDPPDLDIPEPDYQDDVENKHSSANYPPIIRPHPTVGLQDSADNGLAIPAHKLRNPCLESRERMAVHRELLHNAKL